MSPAYRNRALWFSLVVSFVLHVGVIYLDLGLGREEVQDRAFRARLAAVPRFEPYRLGVTRPQQLPRTEMEYLPSAAVPGRLSAEEEVAPVEAPALDLADAPTALRKFSVGGKPDTLILAREVLPRAADFDWTNSARQAEAFDLLRMQDLAGNDRVRATVIPGQNTRRDVSGYVNFSRLRLYGAGTDPRESAAGLDALARYVRDHTRILARVSGARYDYFLSENLLEDPIHFLIEGGGWEPYRSEYLTQISDEEKVLLGRYLREGGFLFIEGGYRYLAEMVRNLREILGQDGRLFPVPASHPLYHSFYEFGGGFPSEYHKEDVVEVTGPSWYYPGSGRSDVIAVNADLSPDEQEAPPTLPNLGIWAVEVNGEIAAVLSDLGMYAGWAGSFQTDPAADGAELHLQAGTNIIIYALTREGGVTHKRSPPAWARTKPVAALGLGGEAAAVRGGEEEWSSEALRAEDLELFDDLDASLALIQSPYGTAIAHNGLSIKLDGRYSLDLLKRGAHGLILHNLPAGDHWLELSYGGKSSELAVRLEGGKVSTVTFGLSRLAMFSSLRTKQQKEVVAVSHWLLSFDDLVIEELFLGEDKQLLE